MKKTKNLLAIVAMMLLIAMLSVAGTVAWLTAATDSVVNTFTVGDIEIELDESDELDLKIIPGKTIAKDPVVTVLANSEACWLFVKIDVANWSEKLTYTVADGWEALDSVAGVYYREVAATTADTDFAVLANNQVVVLDTLTAAEMEAMETAQPEMTFTAYAVQKENVANAAAAWAIATAN